MPKEITHWLIAEETARRLVSCSDADSPDDDTTKTALEAFPVLIHLGALLHDVLYYVRSGKADVGRCTKLANALHGADGEDTFGLLRDLLSFRHSTIQGGGEGALRAFLLGALTHICTDAVFHPYIYYTAGNYVEKSTHFQAWYNHRALESAIDLAFCREQGISLRTFSLGNDLRVGKHEMQFFLRHLAALQRQAPELWAIEATDYENGYTTLAWLRVLFASSPINVVLDVAESIMTPFLQLQAFAELHSYLGLRYSGRSPWSGIQTQTTLHYTHPVSGENYRTTLQELFESAVQESIRVWGILEPMLVEKTGAALIPEQGKSLEVGLLGVASSEMRYFAPMFSALEKRK